MSLYAYLDSARKNIVYAKDIAETDRGTNYYCPNPDCPAVMYLKSRNNAKHFAAKPNTHLKHCFVYSLPNSAQNYNVNNFKMADFVSRILSPAINKSENKISDPYCRRNVDTVPADNLQNINTVFQLFNYCESHSLETKIDELAIDDIICDNRNSAKYKYYIQGFKLVLCKFYYYSLKSSQRSHNTITLLYPYTADKKSGFRITLKIEDPNLMYTLIDIYQKHRNSIVAVFGEFCNNGYRHSSAQITNKKQIYVGKNSDANVQD